MGRDTLTEKTAFRGGLSLWMPAHPERATMPQEKKKKRGKKSGVVSPSFFIETRMFPQEIRKEVADRLADLRAMEEWRELHAKIHKEGWHPRVHYVVPSPDTLIELSMSTVKSYEIALVRYYEELERDPATTWERPEPPNVLAREFDPMKYVKEIEKFGNKKKKKVARVAVDK